MEAQINREREGNTENDDREKNDQLQQQQTPQTKFILIAWRKCPERVESSDEALCQMEKWKKNREVISNRTQRKV